VLDLSKSYSATDVTALRMSDVILLAAQLELSSLRNVVRMLQSLGNDPETADKVRVVLNRVGPENDVSLKKAEETIGKPVFWQLPNDHKTVADARNNGAPLLVHAPRSKVRQSFAGLAQALGAKGNGAAPKEKAKGWTLFSRK
jgi:pilus assembly protein CpaE